MQISGLFHWISGMHTLVALYLWWGVWVQAAYGLPAMRSPLQGDRGQPNKLPARAGQPQQTEYG